MKNLKQHLFFNAFMLLAFLSGVLSCKKPTNSPQSLFSESRVDSLVNSRVHKTKFYSLDLAFPPPEGERWYMVSWIQEDRNLIDRLVYHLNQRLPEFDPVPYLNVIPNSSVDKSQWAMVLLAQRDPNNSAVIFFDAKQRFTSSPVLFNVHKGAAFAKEILVRIQEDSTGYRDLAFIDKATILYPEFYMYGEQLPPEYVEEDDALTMRYGFKIRRIADCEIDLIDMDETVRHNEEMFNIMKKRYGSLWYSRFKNQTGKQLYLEIEEEDYLKYN